MRGVWFNVKIHIVQKSDTFRKIATQYGVDPDELQQLNAHISSPEMIVPGMKIKIPHSAQKVKQETNDESSAEGQEVKPLPEIKEDDEQKTSEIKLKAPINHPSKNSPKQTSKKNRLPESTHIKQDQATNDQQSLTKHPCCQPIHYHYYFIKEEALTDEHIQETISSNNEQINCCCKHMIPIKPQQMAHSFPLLNTDQLRENSFERQSIQSSWPTNHLQEEYFGRRNKK